MKTAPLNKTKKTKVLPEYLLLFLGLLILLLSTFNIHSYFNIKPSTQPVLGANTQTTPEEFWREFLSENQSYIPGWIEIGRIDKATQIDPNYFFK